MKTLIATTLLLGSMSAFAGPYSIKFNKPLVLRGSSLINVEKVENKATAEGKWQESVTNTAKQNCEFSINVEGRDMAVENKGIGEHYYGSMSVSCEKAGLFGSSFKTNFSRVLLMGIRECVVSETVIDNDYCNLRVIALRKETDLNSQSGDLISDKPTSRKFFRISSEDAKKYIQGSNLLPIGVNKDLVDSYQSFNLSIGRNGNEFFIPTSTEKSSFVSGRNIFLKVSDADLNRDDDLRNDIESSLKDLNDQLSKITSGAKPTDVFKQNFPAILGKFSLTVQKLLGIISPVEFFQLEQETKAFEANLITVAKTYNPNVTTRDSFKANYGSGVASLSVMMDYLQSRNQEGSASDSSPSLGINVKVGMESGTFSNMLTNFSEHHMEGNLTAGGYQDIVKQLSFLQFKSFYGVVKSQAVKNLCVKYFYYANHTIMVRKDFNDLLALLTPAAEWDESYQGSTIKSELEKHWTALYLMTR
jgi:hypothetical protein